MLVETENVAAKRPWQHDMYRSVLAWMSAAQYAIFDFEEDRVMPRYGGNGSLAEIFHALFLGQFSACYRGRTLTGVMVLDVGATADL